LCCGGYWGEAGEEAGGGRSLPSPVPHTSAL